MEKGEINMPRYKITQHLSGWKLIENFVDARNEEEATELWNKGDENLNLSNWKVVDEEYKVNDTDIKEVMTKTVTVDEE